MMRVIKLAMLLWAISCAANAQDTLAIHHAQLIRVKDSVQLTMQVDVRNSQVGKHEIVLVEPIIEAPGDAAVILPSVGIYGQYPYYYYIRSGNNWLQQPSDLMYRAKKVRQPIAYVATLPYESWMDTARVNITVSSNLYCEGKTTLSGFTVYSAEPHIVKGKPQVDVENLHQQTSGEAHIDYVINTTSINPTYHNNVEELRRIGMSIDSVKSDTANTISDITIKGYSSPEGPYEFNAKLARGRSNSLTRHIAKTYNIPNEMMRTDFEPEDWEGLRKSVDASDLPHRAEILAVIDDESLNDDLDAKLRLIRTRYPKDFKFILKNVMPYLRRSDYTINYDRRTIHMREGATDTLWTLPEGELLQPTEARLKPFRPLLAVKTNLLFDALMTPNIEVEVPFGALRQWSVMAETWFAWWLFDKNSKASSNPYRLLGVPYSRESDRGYRNAYELWMIGGELRRWFSKCWGDQPLMTGAFAGVYAAGGKYDIEWKGVGDQGEFFSTGFSGGYSWLLGKRLNLELSASVGVLWGPQRHYRGEFDDTHLIWKENRNFFYFGPTKLKLSIVWLLGNTLGKKHRKEVSDE